MMDDVAGKLSEADGELHAEIEERADQDDESPEEEKSAAEIAEVSHSDIIEENPRGKPAAIDDFHLRATAHPANTSRKQTRADFIPSNPTELTQITAAETD